MAEQQQQQQAAAPTTGAIVPLEETEGGDRGGGAAATAAANTGGREYRKGNWTLPETMILINAKKMDDERRLRGTDKEKGKSAEFRWKWVENYCWKNGCQRSQNQCNDKWDNLLRDYKKVREYENKLEPGQKSYWACEKHERKERGLPSNMIIQVYEALHEVVDKRPRPLLAAAAAAAQQVSQSQQQQIQQQFQQIQQQQQAVPSMFGMSSGSQPQQQQQMHHQHHHLPVPQAQATATEISKSTESEGSGTQRSPKRRRVSRSGTGATDQGLGPTLTRSAQEISQTLLACEEKKDKRHQDILGFEERKLGVEERKLMLEETKTEISRQGMEGLIAAVNNLANAILTLASERHQAPS